MLCSCICTCSCSCHEKRQFNETIVFTIVIWSLLRATAASIFATSQLQKVLRDRQFLTLLTSKSSSRRNGVHFLTTSKSPPNLRCLGPNPLCFYQFGFEMCFAPQCRTLSQQLTFQNCSEPEVLVTFWLRNVLRAAAAGNFSTSQLPKVLREWNVFLAFWLPNLLRATMTCNFWSLLPKWLRTRPFSEPTFRSEKHGVSRLFYLSRTLILFLLTLSLLTSLLTLSLFCLFPPLLLHLSILSEVWLLNFLQ